MKAASGLGGGFLDSELSRQKSGFLRVTHFQLSATI